MTNRDMVTPPGKRDDGPTKKDAGERIQKPTSVPLPPMPAEEGSASPTTRDDPVDSPQPNASVERQPPREGEIGLTTKR